MTDDPTPAEATPEASAAESRLGELRDRILEVDDALVRLAGERLHLVLEIGELKSSLGRPVLDPAREAAVVRRSAERARELGIDPELVRDLIWRIIDSARQVQEGRSSWGPPDTAAPADGASSNG